ncbi:MAG: DUF192 domain-containing protein [Solirubrobacterales bacterium]|nr:DUF192 domain-containing protein [Solirubrobacterales bacterium]
MIAGPLPARLAALPRARVLGMTVPVASTFRARLLGLAWIEQDRAGTGLLIPRCRSVHTFGMRFAIEVVFLDSEGREVRRLRLPPRRLAWERRAVAMLELPLA